MSIFAELETGVVARTDGDTQAVAARLAAALPVDRVLALSGDLGAGKTTFVKGLAAAWEVKEVVTSPSFTVCNIHRGTRLLLHVDAYRLPSADAWDALMIEDFLVSPWCLAVEWPERVRDQLPTDTLWIHLEMQDGGARTIRSIPGPA